MVRLPPRVVPLLRSLPPVVLATDGCCEGKAPTTWAGYGAVLWDPVSSRLEAWGAFILPGTLRRLQATVGADQVVGQAELLPCLGARWHWHDLLRGRAVLHYVDNDAAKWGLVRGWSPSPASAWLVDRVWAEDARLGTRSWFDRVASESNGADGPSRGDWPHAWQLGGRPVRRVWPQQPCRLALRMGWLGDERP